MRLYDLHDGHTLADRGTTNLGHCANAYLYCPDVRVHKREGHEWQLRHGKWLSGSRRNK